MRNKLVITLFVFALGALCFAQAPMHPVQKYWSDLYGKSAVITDPLKLHEWQRVAKAQPDECFFAVGDPRNRSSFDAIFPGDLATGPLPCKYEGAFGSQPKVNQAYVWGITPWQSQVWFGTVANTLCLAMEGLAQGGMSPLKMNSVVCEAGTGGNGDARPPRIYVFDTTTNGLTEMTGQIKAAGGAHWDRLLKTVGLRSAGTFGDLVILGGIAGDASGTGGVAMFAFNGRTRKFVDSIMFNGSDPIPYAGVPTNPNDPTKVAQFANIRQWIMAKNSLYVGLAVNAGFAGIGQPSGLIFRFAGTITQPFKFVSVGSVSGDPAYLAYHQDRLIVSTWGGPQGSFGQALYVSPKMSVKGFTPLPASTTEWKEVWRLSNFEVEPSASAAGGAIASFDGALYFTTMTPPGAQMMQFTGMYPGAKTDTASMLIHFLGSYRPTEMFRATDFDNPQGPKFELLYGNPMLPQFQTPTGAACPMGGSPAAKAVQATCDWKMVSNRMKQTPVKGLAGYNNFFNSYTWWMQVYNPTHELFIGSFDWSFLAAEAAFDYVKGIPQPVIDAARQFEGADLLSFHSSNDLAMPVSLNGLGNYSNYGIRTMLVMDLDIYMGTANPFNLLTDPNSPRFDGALGGWELIRLSPTKAWYEANQQP